MRRFSNGDRIDREVFSRRYYDEEFGDWEYDPESGKVWCSERARELMGLAESDGYLLREFLRGVRRETRERFEIKLREAHESGEHFAAELEKSGTQLVLYARSVRYEDDRVRFVGTLLLLSDGREYPDDLTVDMRYKLALTGAGVGLWNWNVVSNVVEWSEEFDQIIGYARDRSRQSFEWFVREIHPEDYDKLISALDSHLTDRTEYDVEVRFKHGDGHYIWLHVCGQAIWNEEGDAVHIGGSIRNVTEKKEGEEALRVAKEKAESGARAKTLFLAMMSHEIRTPLNSILAMLSLLEMTELEGKQGRYVELMRSGGSNLARLIDDILEYSRLDSRSLRIENFTFDLREKVEEIVAPFRKAAKEKSLKFEVKVKPGVAMEVTTDPYRLKQILGNILDNAIKFTHEGDISLEADAGEGDYLLFKISDSGVGVDSEEIKSLGQPFVQANSDWTRKHEGTGLGLAISRELVELMGGSLSMQSQAGKGTVVCFSIKNLSNVEKIPLPSPSRTKLKRLRSEKPVLVVEDNLLNQESISEMMDVMGLSYKMASGAREAFKLLKEEEYSVVLLDIMLPEISGNELARMIRKDNTIRQPYIVAISANAFSEDIEVCLASGVDMHLAKPFALEELHGALSKGLDTLPKVFHDTGD